MNIQYVVLDPTGNLTCLVLDRTDPEKEKVITARLMGECEQVAYLEAPVESGSRARIRLMGGEFCGNATMAAACYLAARDGLTDAEFPMDVSGAEKPVGIVRSTVWMSRYSATSASSSSRLMLPPLRSSQP